MGWTKHRVIKGTRYYWQFRKLVDEWVRPPFEGPKEQMWKTRTIRMPVLTAPKVIRKSIRRREKR